jgi:hypothetical protein
MINRHESDDMYDTSIWRRVNGIDYDISLPEEEAEYLAALDLENDKEGRHEPPYLSKRRNQNE